MHTLRYIPFKATTLVVAGTLFFGPMAVQAQSEAGSSNAPGLNGYPLISDPMAPIVVGPRERLGKESFAKKQGKKVVGGILSKVLGGSGSGSGSKGPKTRRDPTRRQDYQFNEHDDANITTGVRARWTNDGLLISTRIRQSEDKGTFQTVFLEDPTGRRLYPARIEVYKLWTEHSLNVSWSKTTTVDGRVVSQESGGWSDTWTEEAGMSGGEPAEDAPLYPALWQQAGYDRAQAGVRQLGTYFNLAPEELDSGKRLVFYAHITRPEQDPVITEPFNWLLSFGDDKAPLVSLADAPVPADVDDARADRETRSDWGARSAEKPPCEEAVLRVEEAKNKYLAELANPLPLLRAALAAAQRVGEATAALGRANANLAAEQARLDAMMQFLEAWDAWSEAKIEGRAKSRAQRYGAREPAWAQGSAERARKRHQQRSADLRARAQAQQQNVQQAQSAVSQAESELAAANSAFQQALSAFANALQKLRGAKDLFTEEVTVFYRCSPCETIAGHFASAARLNELLDRMRGMLEQARAAAAAQRSQAQSAAAAAQQNAQQAKDKLEQLENRRTEIEQEMRDAVDTRDGCLSFEPQEGGGWMNLATMDGVRGTIVPEGAAMGWRSNFKGSDVRVYSKPGCLQAKIENINWRKINELNRELTDLQSELADAGREMLEAQRQAALAQAEVDGLQAQIGAIDELIKALLASGIEQNTEAVLDQLDDLSRACNTQLKKEIEKVRVARERQRRADERAAAARGTRDSLGRRAGAAGDALGDVDSSDGTADDRNEHDQLKGKARDIQDRAGTGTAPARGDDTGSPAPGSLEEAGRQSEAAEDAADEAEDIADELERENKDLEDEVRELEDDVSALASRQNAWRRYYEALARYRDCLKKKQQALEELAEMNDEMGSALKELARIIGEASEALEGAASAAGGIASVSKKARAANKKAADLADALDSLSKAMSILDSIMRRDDLSPSERLKAMSDAFELLRKGLPYLPGVSEMFEFYNEAMKAIAGKIAEIADTLTRQWADAVIAGVADADMAPVGIRKEVKRLVKLRELMKIISRDCGNPPVPPG